MKDLRRKLERIYDESSQKLFLCAIAITRRKDWAEEAIQNAFYQLLRLQHEPNNLLNYVFVCVRNAAIDLIRQGKHIPNFDEIELFPDPFTPRKNYEDREFRQRIATCLQELTEDERETMIQHLFADLTFREIADLRNISINTAMSWYRRGLEKMRKRLEDA